MVIKRVAPISAARIAAALYAVAGLLFGALLAALRGFQSSNSLHPVLGLLSNFAFGIGAIILLPLAYGMLGFVGAFLSAALYNFLAGIVGGIQIDVE